jgi:hypothetical protein
MWMRSSHYHFRKVERSRFRFENRLDLKVYVHFHVLFSGCTLNFTKPRTSLFDYSYCQVSRMDEEALSGLVPMSDPQLQRRVSIVVENK